MTLVDLDDSKVILEEDTNEVKPLGVSREVKSFMAVWLVKKKIAKNDTQAKLLLLAISLISISLSIIFFYYGSLNITQNKLQNSELVPVSNK